MRRCEPTHPDTCAACSSPRTFVAVVADEGYPQPTIAREEFEAALGGVHRASRRAHRAVDRGSPRGGHLRRLVQRFEATANDGRRRPAADRVQVDHRLPHGTRRHRPVVVRRRRGVRPLARRRLGRVARACEARARLPAAARVRDREGPRPRVPSARGRGRPRREPHAREAVGRVRVPRGAPGPAGADDPQRLAVGRRGHLHRHRAARTSTSTCPSSCRGGGDRSTGRSR